MLASILANKGPLPTFTDPDTSKTYTFSFLTQAKKVAFELWLTDRAERLVVGMKNKLSPDDWDRQMLAFRREVAAGTYGFHSAVAQEALQTGEGCSALMAILLDCPQEELIDLMARHGTQVTTTLDRVVEQSTPKLKKADASAPTEAPTAAEGDSPNV